MKKVPVLILTGDGINCERETARAFSLVGADPVIVHVNDLLENPRRLHEFEAAAFPGGFSFGDDLGSGQVLALKVSLLLGDELRGFLEAKKPVIGICNGFQALTKLGLLPEPFGVRKMALAGEWPPAAAKGKGHVPEPVLAIMRRNAGPSRNE